MPTNFRKEVQATNQECAVCGEDTVTTRLVDQEFLYGDTPTPEKLMARVLMHSCSSCGAEYTDGSAEEVRHEAVCRRLGLLAPVEIHAIRQARGLSRQRFAEISRLGTATLSRWEGGEVMQNAALDVYLRLLAKDEIFCLISSGELWRSDQGVRERASHEQIFGRFPTLSRQENFSRLSRAAECFVLAPSVC